MSIPPIVLITGQPTGLEKLTVGTVIKLEFSSSSMTEKKDDTLTIQDVDVKNLSKTDNEFTYTTITGKSSITNRSYRLTFPSKSLPLPFSTYYTPNPEGFIAGNAMSGITVNKIILLEGQGSTVIGGTRITYKGKKYTVKLGSKGGKYIMVNGVKKYV